MSRKNLIVGQSGGPTAVINSSLYGVVSEGMRHPEAIEHVYGMINGIEGFLNGTVLDFAEALPGEKLDGLKVTPGAYLGSCRYKLPEDLSDTVYPKLFEKGYIGNLKVKNRIIRNSMGTYLADGNMYVGDRTIKAGAEAASGGVGVVFMDNCTIKEMYHMGLCAANDTYIPGLSMLAEAIKDHGALAGMQLSHPGRDTGFVGGTEVVAASSVTFEPWYEAGAALPKPLTIDEIHDLVDKYGQAALRCKKAGFDLVEVHGAGGCLPTNFLSPNDNQRNDMYGGSLHNRMRFLVEIVRSIKKYCGNNYPISIKLSIDDCEPNGIRVEETVEVAKVLEKEGVSMLNLMMGTHAVVYPSTGFYDINIYLSQAKQIKDAVQIPCMVGLGVIS